MKMFLLALSLLVNTFAFAGDVTLTLNGPKGYFPSCEVEGSLARVDGVLTLYLNGGKYCNSYSVSKNGTHLATRAMPRLFGSIAGDSVLLGETEGDNNFVVIFSGNGRSDKITFSVKKKATTKPIDVYVDANENTEASLEKCGGSISVSQDVLGDVSVQFSGVDSCHNGILETINGKVPPAPVTWSISEENGYSMTLSLPKNGNHRVKGLNKFIVKLWSKPIGKEKSVIREYIQISVNC